MLNIFAQMSALPIQIIRHVITTKQSEHQELASRDAGLAGRDRLSNVLTGPAELPIAGDSFVRLLCLVVLAFRHALDLPHAARACLAAIPAGRSQGHR